MNQLKNELHYELYVHHYSDTHNKFINNHKFKFVSPPDLFRDNIHKLVKGEHYATYVYSNPMECEDYFGNGRDYIKYNGLISTRLMGSFLYTYDNIDNYLDKLAQYTDGDVPLCIDIYNNTIIIVENEF